METNPNPLLIAGEQFKAVSLQVTQLEAEYKDLCASKDEMELRLMDLQHERDRLQTQLLQVAQQ